MIKASKEGDEDVMDQQYLMLKNKISTPNVQRQFYTKNFPKDNIEIDNFDLQ